MRIDKTYTIAFIIILLCVSFLIYHKYHVDLNKLEGPAGYVLPERLDKFPKNADYLCHYQNFSAYRNNELKIYGNVKVFERDELRDGNYVFFDRFEFQEDGLIAKYDIQCETHSEHRICSYTTDENTGITTLVNGDMNVIKYNRNGFAVEYGAMEDGKYNVRNSFIYDADGYLLSRRDHSFNGVAVDSFFYCSDGTIEMKSFKQNALGELITDSASVVKYDKYGYFEDMPVTYTLYDDGHVKTRTVANSYSSNKYVQEFDEEGRLVAEWYDYNGEITPESQFKYSKYGRLLSEIRYKNGIETLRNEYQVSKGKIIWVEYQDGELKGIIDCDKFGNHLSTIDKNTIFKYEYFD